MKTKVLLLGIVTGVAVLVLGGCNSAAKNEVSETKTSVTKQAEALPAKVELQEILDNTIPDLNEHFDTTDEGLEAFIRQVEEFPPLVELSMIDVIRERGPLYFNEEQMNRLNKALDETTAL